MWYELQSLGSMGSRETMSMKHDMTLTPVDVAEGRAVMVTCPDCGQLEVWSEQESNDHGLCRAKGGVCWCEGFTVGELATVCTGGNISAMTKMLNDAGAQPRLNELVSDPAALAMAGRQIVSRAAVIDLLAMRAGDRVGRKLAGLLS